MKDVKILKEVKMIIGKAQYEEYLSNFSTERVFFSINEGEEYIKNAQAESSVLNISVCDFYDTIKNSNNSNIEEINLYLQGFYNKVLPIINNKYGGKVDRINADNIIAVFSNEFKFRNTVYGNILKDAYYCAKELIVNLKGSEYRAKIGLAIGNIYFCQAAANDSHYQEVLCVGEPLIYAYNLQNVADANEILTVNKSSEIIYTDEELKSGWAIGSDDYNFKGLGLCNVKKLIKI